MAEDLTQSLSTRAPLAVVATLTAIVDQGLEQIEMQFAKSHAPGAKHQFAEFAIASVSSELADAVRTGDLKRLNELTIMIPSRPTARLEVVARLRIDGTVDWTFDRLFGPKDDVMVNEELDVMDRAQRIVTRQLIGLLNPSSS